MNTEFLDLGGDPVPADGLRLPRAQAVARIAGSEALDHVRLVGCYRLARCPGVEEEAVVLDVGVHRGQVTVNDIRHTERVAAVFGATDTSSPDVLSLRAGFPRVPHLNLGATELPRSLCLYDQSWHQLRMRWTAAAFIERIREWLALTARGELHREDQPLEPLLFGSGLQLVVPSDLFTASGSGDLERLDVTFAHEGEGCTVLVARKAPVRPDAKAGAAFVAASFVADHQTHGQIRRAPADLKELHEFLLPAGIDLLASLRQRLRDWPRPSVRDARLIIIVAFPLTRSEGSSVEANDLWAFCCLKSIKDIGVSIGVFDQLPGGEEGLLLEVDAGKTGEGVPLELVRPQFSFSRAQAAKASGLPQRACAAVAVGVGALGSQVVETLARSGFGQWTLIDADDLLPHNLARHALGPFFVGRSKSIGMATQLNQLYRDGGGAQAMQADILASQNQSERIGQAFASAEVILDMAASVPVSRHLALDVAGAARRLALFLNPRGTDLVLLAEDQARTRLLDGLEMQYYRAVATDGALDGHFATPDKLRYARSCRDVTSVFPTHLVGMLASIAAGAARQACESPDAVIRVWRADPGTLAVSTHTILPAAAYRHRLGEWTIVLDDVLLASLRRQREAKLPRETGGVLLGAYDFQRRIVYVVDSLPSPPDSQECQDLYIRGCEGLTDRLASAVARSGGQLEYIGEWHSHPNGCACAPSERDIALFGWLAGHLGTTGQPALMAIVCQGGVSTWCLDSLEPGGRWEVRAGEAC